MCEDNIGSTVLRLSTVLDIYFSVDVTLVNGTQKQILLIQNFSRLPMVVCMD